MAAAVVTVAGTRFAGGGGSLTQNITVSGTNPVLIVHVTAQSIFDDSQFGTAVSWSLGGSLTKVAQKRNTVDGVDALVQTWVLAAPSAGAGTVTVTFNVAGSARDCHIIAEVWSGADQSNPCPVGDVIQKDTNESPSTATPTNLVTGDATSSVACATGGGISGSTPETWYANGSNPSTNAGVGYDTTGVTYTFTGLGASNHAITAVRIVGVAGGSLSDTPTV